MVCTLFSLDVKQHWTVVNITHQVFPATLTLGPEEPASYAGGV